MQLQTIPRGLVELFLDITRLPISAAERVARPEDADSWPPALTFAAFESSVHQTVGALLHDSDLQHRGSLERARVDELRESVRLSTIAEQERTEADQSFQARRQADEQRRKEAEQRAERREQDAERQRRQAEERAEKQAETERERARKTAEAREDAVEKRARSTRVRTIAEEREAVASAEKAAEAEAEALEVDKELEASKKRRKSS